jgi:hypothetical protein
MPFGQDMCDEWKVERWLTPISDVRSIALVALVDNCHDLFVVVEAPRKAGRPRWLFRFPNYPAYRNMVEGIRTRLWRHLDETHQRCGHTFVVTSSSWADEVAAKESLLKVYHPEVKHFVITTEDDVIEVLSDRPAEIKSLGTAPPHSRPAGKSEVYYVPEDGASALEILKDPN